MRHHHSFREKEKNPCEHPEQTGTQMDMCLWAGEKLDEDLQVWAKMKFDLFFLGLPLLLKGQVSAFEIRFYKRFFICWDQSWTERFIGVLLAAAWNLTCREGANPFSRVEIWFRKKRKTCLVHVVYLVLFLLSNLLHCTLCASFW